MATERAIAPRTAAQLPALSGSAIDIIDAHERAGFIVVAPANLSITDPRFMISRTILKIDPNPKGGDVHKMPGGGGLILARPALDRIGLFAGIFWDSAKSGVISASRDYVLYKAVGELRSESGERVPLPPGTKEIDMQVIEEEMKAEHVVKVYNKGNEEYSTWKRKVLYEDLTPAQQAEVDRATLKEVLIFRKHKVARAETGARLRVVKSMGIKSSYTAEELARPFVIFRVVPNPENAMVRASMKQASMSLYGDFGGGTGRAPFADAEDAETQDVENETPKAPEMAQEQAQTPTPSDPSPSSNAQPTPESAPVQGDVTQAPTENKEYLNEEGAKRLIGNYAEQFRVPFVNVIGFVGAQFGVAEFTELTTDQVPAVRRWIQENAPKGKQRA